ncbi:MAG: hypothetical protein ABIP94_22330 [Planctomycetota bacterium]
MTLDEWLLLATAPTRLQFSGNHGDGKLTASLTIQTPAFERLLLAVSHLAAESSRAVEVLRRLVLDADEDTCDAAVDAVWARARDASSTHALAEAALASLLEHAPSAALARLLNATQWQGADLVTTGDGLVVPAHLHDSVVQGWRRLLADERLSVQQLVEHLGTLQGKYDHDEEAPAARAIEIEGWELCVRRAGVSSDVLGGSHGSS